MSRPRVVHLSTVHHLHDVRITVKEAASLARAGFAVTVVARAGEPVADRPDGLALEPLPATAGRVSRLLGVREAARRAIAHRPALVHLHDPELLAIVPRLRAAGARVVYDMHEDLPRQLMAKPWLPRWSRAPFSRLVAAVEPRLVARCDGLVVVDGAWLERHPGPPAALVRNLPLAREVRARGEDPPPVHRRPPRLVYAGGVDESRGATVMVRAMHAACTDGAAPADARLDVCGPVRPPALGDALAALDPTRRTALHGWLDRPRLLALLDGARAGLLMLAPHPNYAHAYATKLYEYLRAGLPVIASDLPSHREVIERHGCGLIVPYGDVDALADAMRRLLTDDALTERLAAGAREAWRASRTFESEFDDLLALYAKLGVTPDETSANESDAADTASRTDRSRA